MSNEDTEMATPAQINMALRLARQNAEGSLDLSLDQAKRMTKREISRLIDSLRNEW
jgi:hypothetical protein